MGQSIKIYYNVNTEHHFSRFPLCSFRIPALNANSQQ